MAYNYQYRGGRQDAHCHTAQGLLAHLNHGTEPCAGCLRAHSRNMKQRIQRARINAGKARV